MRWRRVLTIVLVTLVVLWIVWGAAVFFTQRSLVFPRPQPPRVPQIPGAELLRVPHDGTFAVALFLPARGAQPTVVHFHGNGEQLADLGHLAQAFARSGIGLLAVEYPGYGVAPGTPGEKSIVAAGEATLAYARDSLRIPADRIVLEGQSIGTGAAAELAEHGYGTRLVLISPYTSLRDFARQVLPLHPARLLVRDPFDTIDRAPHIRQPVLLVHGLEDETIPVQMGERVAHALPHVTPLFVEGAGHNDILTSRVLDAIVAFVQAGR